MIDQFFRLFKKATIVGSLMLLPGLIFGQVKEEVNGCAKTLQNARKTYEQGRIEEIPGLLNKCLQSGFNEQEKVEAYRLLTLANLYFDEKGKAQESMLKMLKIDPEYEINPVVDPPEFINLYNMFRTNPVYLFGGMAGANFTQVNVLQNYSLDNPEITDAEYRVRTGYHVGVVFEFSLSKKISLMTGPQFNMLTYEYRESKLGFVKETFVEKQSRISLPITFKYEFNGEKVQPFIRLGAEGSYLLGAEAEVERFDDLGDLNVDDGNRGVKGPPVDLSEQRMSFNWSLVAGGGIKIKELLGKGYFTIDVRYAYGMMNAVNAENRYSNIELKYDYLHLDDDFQLNNLMISIGYTVPVYRPKLKKNKKELVY
ncbi:porin family protein [Mangrovivirga sp. M17]|uniref:Porin family protein n=1 Tax=Mangrovivirga halotolerans TaxID=2993936 RepID=A0ABT3RLU8_9BACT|nr:porin family protein [Mangrovivirga halotolerans]MCX2742684.1 porin family protein [Mangrovivirga halotolerans]